MTAMAKLQFCNFVQIFVAAREIHSYMDDPTQFYSMHKLQTFPKQYNVNKKVDLEFCEKNFPQHHDFADGIFSIGCCCELSIRNGYEIMMAYDGLEPPSPPTS